MTEPLPSKELLPCPFCGEIPELNQADNDPNWWIVACEGERCELNPYTEQVGRDEAIKIWNRRPTI